MKSLLLTCALFGWCAIAAPAADQPAPAATGPQHWWQANSDWRRPEHTQNATTLPPISVNGNRFVNPAGETMLFRGVCVADPDKLEGQGQWNRELFVAVKAMGANIVRLPVHPIAWRERTPQAYLALLDQAVDWCSELGLYVMIDWHSIGNMHSGLYQAPMYNTSVPESLEFWRTIASHFHGHNTVAFYELFNEPAHIRGVLGDMTWTQWKEINEQMIAVIRASDKETIPLVAGFDWAYDLTAVRHEPVRADGIGYAVHPYEHQRTRPWEPKWEEDFGYVASKYPMIGTEFGFELKDGEVADAGSYGVSVTRYMEQRGIGWIAWCFDPQWGPRLLKSFDGYALSGSGEVIKQALQRAPLTAVKPVPTHGDTGNPTQ